MTYPPETPPSSTYPGETPSYPAPASTYSDGTYASPTPASPPDAGNGSPSSTTEAAKQQASQVGETASQAGQQVADVAKEQAANVAEQTKTEAKNLLNQTRDELSSQAGNQQQRVAGGLRSLGSELQSMASKSDTDGPATQVARQAADRIQTAAGWLEDREPGQVLTEVQRFARQRPGAFLALAAVAGLAVGRLTRGLAADSSSDSASSSGQQAEFSDQSGGAAYDSGQPGTGWQGSAPAPDPAGAYISGYAPAQAFDAPQATSWQDPNAPVAGSDYYGPGTGTVGGTGQGTPYGGTGQGTQYGDPGTGTVNR